MPLFAFLLVVASAVGFTFSVCIKPINIPIAPSSIPLLAVRELRGLAAYLLLREDISFMGGMGILLVCIGIVQVGFENSLKQKYFKGLGFPLFAGLMIVN